MSKDNAICLSPESGQQLFFVGGGISWETRSEGAVHPSTSQAFLHKAAAMSGGEWGFGDESEAAGSAVASADEVIGRDDASEPECPHKWGRPKGNIDSCSYARSVCDRVLARAGVYHHAMADRNDALRSGATPPKKDDKTSRLCQQLRPVGPPVQQELVQAALSGTCVDETLGKVVDLTLGPRPRFAAPLHAEAEPVGTTAR